MAKGLREARTAGGVALAVFLAGDASYTLSVGSVVSVWFPSGLALALLLLNPRGSWVTILAGVYLGNVGADFVHVGPVGLRFLAPAANILESVCAAWVVHGLARTPNPVLSLRGAGALLVGGATLSNAVTALVGGAVLHAFYSAPFWQQWLSWWIGDGMGMIAVTPAILGLTEWLRRQSRSEAVKRGLLELVSLALAVSAVIGIAFSRQGSLNPFLSVMVFPLLVLAGLRLNIGAHVIVLLTTILALWFSSRGLGPLVNPTLTPMEMTLQVFAFVCITAVSVLVLAAVVAEREVGAEQREKLESQLAQASKMEAIGRLTGGIAHDFNNMLTVIIGHAEFAETQVGEDHPVREDIEQIHFAAERSAKLTRQLLGFARRQTIAPRVIDLNESVDGMLGMLRRLVGEDVPLVFKPDPAAWPTSIDPTQVEQILMNLSANARDAIDDKGTIVLETGNAHFDERYCRSHPGFIPGDFVMLAVTDDGRGMSAETLAHAFEPFFTTKAVDRGTGLGLASVYGIVKQNGGFINLYSEPQGGTSAKIYLPALPGTAVSSSKPMAKSVKPVATGTILLVDDDEAILSLSEAKLRRVGHEVIPAPTPTVALELAAAHEGDIDLLVTDVILPEMNGRQLADRLLAISPTTRVLFTSGYTANVIVQRGILKDGVAFLPKPYGPGELAEAVGTMLSES